MVDIVGVGFRCGPIGGVAHPGGGHPELGGRSQVAGDVLDHDRGPRLDRVPLQQQPIAGQGRLRLELRGDDIDDPGERIANSEMIEQPLGMPDRAVGMDDLAAAQLAERGDERRIGRNAGQVDIVNKGEKLVRVDGCCREIWSGDELNASDVAPVLRDAVEARFWMEDRGFYALALDGRGRPCRVRASNAGHLLYVGLPAPERAAQLARQLLSPAFDGGWGVRTLAHGEVRFNPMSYHNGSVWPHDTALCAAGLARYGERRGAIRILGETFEAAVHFGMRLPELYCGFARAPGEPPIAYPVACLPQAWSAGAVFMMLQACLGLTIDARRREVMIDRPELPMGVDRIELRRLAVGDTVLDLVFERVGGRIVAVPAGADADVVRVMVRA